MKLFGAEKLKPPAAAGAEGCASDFPVAAFAAPNTGVAVVLLAPPNTKPPLLLEAAGLLALKLKPPLVALFVAPAPNTLPEPEPEVVDPNTDTLPVVPNGDPIDIEPLVVDVTTILPPNAGGWLAEAALLPKSEPAGVALWPNTLPPKLPVDNIHYTVYTIDLQNTLAGRSFEVGKTHRSQYGLRFTFLGIRTVGNACVTATLHRVLLGGYWKATK